MDSIKCKTLVSKKLPYCEHTKTIRCSEPAEDTNYFCLECAPEKVKSQVPDMIINTFEAAVSSLYQAKLAKENSVDDLVENLLNFQISDNSSSSFDHYVNAVRSTPSETFQETLSQVGISIPQVDRHWYQCPNGHPYTIGECGGAMVMSRCPDCNAPIGGGDHRLTTGNRINSDFESMH
ncbi:unnamed protein product [Rhizophagus irregularis]|nr:unnamed protein product [Rhizophagus irregularis]